MSFKEYSCNYGYIFNHAFRPNPWQRLYMTKEEIFQAVKVYGLIKCLSIHLMLVMTLKRVFYVQTFIDTFIEQQNINLMATDLIYQRDLLNH